MIKKSLIASAAVLIISGSLFLLLNAGVNRAERAECYQWQQQAKEFPAFYLTRWQTDQCRAQGLEVAAPVK